MNILGLQKTTLLDYPGHVATTIFTGGCNFRCPYCHNGDLVLHPETMEAYSMEEVLEHFHRRVRTLTGICITGGEPTLQTDLVEFIKELKQFQLPIKLDTNGSRPDVLQRLVEEHLIDYVAMDIKHSREKYSTIANHPTFDLSCVEASVDFLKAGTLPYEFRTTLTKELHHKEDLTAIGEWLKGCQAYYMQPYRESEEVINPIYHPHTKEELEEFVTLLHPYIANVSIRGLD